MKHTKGKWEVKTGLTQLNCYAIQKNGEGLGICMINHELSEYVANARLISKAPEMYEALKDIIDRYPNSPWIIEKLQSLIKEIEA